MNTKEIKRQDEIDNMIMDLIIRSAPANARESIDWDIDKIGKIRDSLEEVICEDLGLMTHEEFYPYVGEGYQKVLLPLVGGTIIGAGSYTDINGKVWAELRVTQGDGADKSVIFSSDDEGNNPGFPFVGDYIPVAEN